MTATLPLPRHARACTCEGATLRSQMCADCIVLRPLEDLLDARPAGRRRRSKGRRKARRDERGSAHVPGLVHLVAQRTGVTPDLRH